MVDHNSPYVYFKGKMVGERKKIGGNNGHLPFACVIVHG
jgi:hypothetical protein